MSLKTWWANKVIVGSKIFELNDNVAGLFVGQSILAKTVSLLLTARCTVRPPTAEEPNPTFWEDTKGLAPLRNSGDLHPSSGDYRQLSIEFHLGFRDLIKIGGMSSSATSTKGGGGKSKASKSVSRSQKAGLQFLVGRIARFLKAGKYAKCVGAGAPIYLSIVLEYLVVELEVQYCQVCKSGVAVALYYSGRLLLRAELRAKEQELSYEIQSTVKRSSLCSWRNSKSKFWVLFVGSLWCVRPWAVFLAG
ncbi:unnamed protein product [Ilex paraguariensis]|uniref:Histone H2A n=1 Tax=Ilex paraguariensis TaxID=185542 RepID=A0ABC8TAZ2_9AQUA